MARSMLSRLRGLFHRNSGDVADQLSAQESRQRLVPAQDDAVTRVPGLLRRSRWGVDGLVSRRAKTNWKGD
jgi:hypothetical protein